MYQIFDPPSIKFEFEPNTSDSLTKELKAIQESTQYIYQLLRKHLKTPAGPIHHYYVIPGPKYPQPYLWDSVFISGIWRYWDTHIAKDILFPFLDLQSKEGLCPQNIRLGVSPNWNITNPPLISWGLLEAARMDGDYSILNSYFPKLKKFNEFLYRARMKNGLFVWKHSYESGIDNTPRFTTRDEKLKFDLSHLWAVDLNSWMVVNNDQMAKIADSLGFAEDVVKFTQKADQLRNQINKYLWDPTSKMYYDYDFQKAQFIDIPTIASLFPLFACVASKDRAQYLIQKIRDLSFFNTLIPFPTVARMHPEFVKDCWRGPVWINTAYIGIKGLENYGEKDLAAEFAYRLVKGVALTYRNEGSIYEFYDPDQYSIKDLSRKKGNLWKQITLGAKPVSKFVGWSGLVNTLFFEKVLGIKVVNKKLSCNPIFPQAFRNLQIHVTLPQFHQKIFINVKDSKDFNIQTSSSS